MPSRTSALTISVASPASTTAASCPASTEPFTARCNAIEALVGSEEPPVAKYRMRMGAKVRPCGARRVTPAPTSPGSSPRTDCHGFAAPTINRGEVLPTPPGAQPPDARNEQSVEGAQGPGGD